MSLPILFIVGTRPEGIKLIPLFKKLRDRGHNVLLCATKQHRQMLDEVLSVFNVVPDFDLDIMRDNQDLFYVTAAVLKELQSVLEKVKPVLIFVHGDTTTTFASSLAAFYKGIPIAHVEAGLRTGNMRHPFPEEMNRKFVGQLASLNFAPTPYATAHLLAEGVDQKSIFCVGNTVVDALYEVKEHLQNNAHVLDPEFVETISCMKKKYKKLFLVTAHRRESYGTGLENVFKSFSEFALKNQDEIGFIHPVHPSPAVKEALEKTDFHSHKNVFSCDPLSYLNMVYMLLQIDYIATDSGGLQEEGSALGKPVICLRDITERHEGVWDGLEVLTGTDPTKIINACEAVMKKDVHAPSHVYGDGNACMRIITILETKYPHFLSDSPGGLFPVSSDFVHKEKNI